MGYYIVTKVIHGIAYHYEQRTYRAGGRVRTESHYLGRADRLGLGLDKPMRALPARDLGAGSTRIDQQAARSERAARARRTALVRQLRAMGWWRRTSTAEGRKARAAHMRWRRLHVERVRTVRRLAAPRPSTSHL